MKIFLDKEGANPEWEGFIAPPSDGSEYIEARPYVEMPDDTDLSTMIVDGGVLRDITPPEIQAMEAERLTTLKQQVKAEIDEAATNARDKYRAANKDATYLNKSAELDRYIAAGRPDPVIESEFPYLYNEALETETTVTVTANLIEAARAIWVPAIDPVIEGKCRGGKVKVDAATTVAEAEHARDLAITMLEGI